MSNNVIPFPGTTVPAAPQAPSSPISDPDPEAWVEQRIWTIRYDKTFNLDQKARIIYNFIWSYESSRTRAGCAWLSVDGRPYLWVYDPRRPRLLEIDNKNLEFTSYFFLRYGLTHSEPLTRHLIDMLRNGAAGSGHPRTERRFSYWDRWTKTLYISSYDGYCWEITGAPIDPKNPGDQRGVTSQPNGAGRTLFIDDDRGMTPADPLLGSDNRALFRHLIEDLQYAPTREQSGMSPEIQKTCLGIWIFAIAFPDLLPTKPILLIEGDPGSGKTMAMQRIALALHGENMPIQVPKQEDKDFGVKILRRPIAILDDINEPVTWLRDMLCTYATGGGWSKRKHYTNDAEHVIKPESFLAITTNNPSTFRQAQLADRCLILRLERREDKNGYLGAEALFEQIRADRDEIFGDWLTWLNEIVAELRKNRKPRPTKSRMADFAHLAHVIGRVLSRPGGPKGNWSPEAIDTMLTCMQSERNALVIEGDPLTEIIDRWLEVASNQGREVRVSDLHRELANIARASGSTTFFKSPKALATRLKEADAALKEHFEISRRVAHGGVTMYTFRRT
jgi:MoxR-like ATPase